MPKGERYDLFHDPLHARRHVDSLPIPPAARHVLSVLADYVPNVHPSLDNLRERTGLSRPTIIKYIRWLEQEGLIRMKKPPRSAGGPGRGHATVYTLTCLSRNGNGSQRSPGDETPQAHAGPGRYAQANTKPRPRVEPTHQTVTSAPQESVRPETQDADGVTRDASEVPFPDSVRHSFEGQPGEPQKVNSPYLQELMQFYPKHPRWQDAIERRAPSLWQEKVLDACKNEEEVVRLVKERFKDGDFLPQIISDVAETVPVVGPF